MRVALLPVGFLVAIAATGCGEVRDTRVRGDTLTVYMSVPRHGVSAEAGGAALEGARTALTVAGGRVGGRRVRLVALSSSQAGGGAWDPSAVKLAAEQAAKDPSAIAYIGELDSGASAVSLPVTNAARLLQVSPSDGLTSLTRSPSGRAGAGPERLRPEGIRTFVRLVPADLQVARTLMRRALSRGARSVAIVHTEGAGERELAASLARLAQERDTEAVMLRAVRDAPEEAEGVAREVAGASPGAVIFAGVPGPGTAVLLRALARRLPGVEVLCAPTMHRRATGATSPRCGLTLTSAKPVRAHAHEAMRVVLEAIGRGGPDRDAVVGAALAPRERRSRLGRYTVRRTGDVTGLPLTFVRSRAGPAARPRPARAP